MEYILLILLIIIAIKFNQSKFVTLLMLFLIVIIFGLNNHHTKEIVNYDFYNYNIWFQIPGNQPITGFSNEPLFRKLIELFKRMNFNITHLRLFIALFGMLLLSYSIKKFTNRIAAVLALYLIFPFINDVIQIRNFLSYAIVIYSFTLYFKFNGTKKIVIPLILVVISGLIHQSSYIYILFLIMLCFSIPTLKKTVVIVFLMGIFLIYSGIFQMIISLISDNFKIDYYTSRITYEGAIIVIGTLLLIYFTMHLVYHRLKTDKNYFGNTEKGKFVDFVYKLNLISLGIGFLWLLDFNFIRLYRNIFIFNYIVFIYYLFEYKAKNNYETILKPAIFLHILFLCALFHLSDFNLYVKPAISDNYFFDAIRMLFSLSGNNIIDIDLYVMKYRYIERMIKYV